MAWKGPDFDVPNNQSALRHPYLNELPRNKMGRITGGSTAMAATSASPAPSSVICHRYGKAGHYRSGWAMPAKPHGKRDKPTGQKKESGSGGLYWAGVVCCA